MNAVNNETDNRLKQSSNDCRKTPATENEYNKLENSQTQIENPDYTENKLALLAEAVKYTDYWGIRPPPPQRVSWYGTKQSYDKAPVILKL